MIPSGKCSTLVALIAYDERSRDTTGGVMAMTETGSGSGFYEEDEPVDKIVAIFETGTKGITAPSSAAAGQILSSRHFILVTRSLRTMTGLGSQRREFVQA
jgi:hypothetical protein